MQFIKGCGAALLAVTIGACGSSGGNSGHVEPSVGSACTSADIKKWAYDNMRDYYLFSDQIPVVDPASYASANTLVEDLRVKPHDRFSHVTSSDVSDETFFEGKTFGVGYQWQQGSDNRIRVSAVYNDSPLGRAGTINRGDEFVAINGVAMGNLTDDQYQSFVGTREQPKTAAWTFRDAQSQQLKVVSLTPTLYNINTVMHSESISLAEHSGKIGYLVLDSFLKTSEAELDDAMTAFRNDGINELVLDLRYNGGGLVKIAAKLASQIAGSATGGNPLMEYRHNNKYSEYNFSIDFADEAIDLELNRLIVLTTKYTASSSEIVINALRPYIEVITIGSRTTGKPYITRGNDYCGTQMHALQAEGFNANDVSVYGGIAPSCGGTDDLTRDFGMPANNLPIEGMLKDALDYIVLGSCKTPLLADNPSLQNDSPIGTALIERFTEKRYNTGARM